MFNCPLGWTKKIKKSIEYSSQLYIARKISIVLLGQNGTSLISARTTFLKALL